MKKAGEATTRTPSTAMMNGRVHMVSMLHRGAGRRTRRTTALPRRTLESSLRRHAGEGRDVGSANYKARLQPTGELGYGAKVCDARQQKATNPTRHDCATRDCRDRRHGHGVRFAGGSSGRTYSLSASIDSFVALIAALASNSSAVICSAARTTARFDLHDAAARHHRADRLVEVLRDRPRVLRRRVAADRILLVEDRDLQRVLLGAHRSPPCACCRRNRTRSSICLARVPAASSLRLQLLVLLLELRRRARRAPDSPRRPPALRPP